MLEITLSLKEIITLIIVINTIVVIKQVARKKLK